MVASVPKAIGSPRARLVCRKHLARGVLTCAVTKKLRPFLMAYHRAQTSLANISQKLHREMEEEIICRYKSFDGLRFKQVMATRAEEINFRRQAIAEELRLFSENADIAGRNLLAEMDKIRERGLGHLIPDLPQSDYSLPAYHRNLDGTPNEEYFAAQRAINDTAYRERHGKTHVDRSEIIARALSEGDGVLFVDGRPCRAWGVVQPPEHDDQEMTHIAEVAPGSYAACYFGHDGQLHQLTGPDDKVMNEGGLIEAVTREVMYLVPAGQMPRPDHEPPAQAAEILAEPVPGEVSASHALDVNLAPIPLVSFVGPEPEPASAPGSLRPPGDEPVGGTQGPSSQPVTLSVTTSSLGVEPDQLFAPASPVAVGTSPAEDLVGRDPTFVTIAIDPPTPVVTAVTPVPVVASPPLSTPLVQATPLPPPPQVIIKPAPPAPDNTTAYIVALCGATVIGFGLAQVIRGVVLGRKLGLQVRSLKIQRLTDLTPEGGLLNDTKKERNTAFIISGISALVGASLLAGGVLLYQKA